MRRMNEYGAYFFLGSCTLISSGRFFLIFRSRIFFLHHLIFWPLPSFTVHSEWMCGARLSIFLLSLSLSISLPRRCQLFHNSDLCDRCFFCFASTVLRIERFFFHTRMAWYRFRLIFCVFGVCFFSWFVFFPLVFLFWVSVFLSTTLRTVWASSGSGGAEPSVTTTVAPASSVTPRNKWRAARRKTPFLATCGFLDNVTPPPSPLIPFPPRALQSTAISSSSPMYVPLSSTSNPVNQVWVLCFSYPSSSPLSFPLFISYLLFLYPVTDLIHSTSL